MKTNRHRSLLTLAIYLSALAPAVTQAEPPTPATPSGGLPRVFLIDAKQLDATRQRIRNGDEKLQPALKQLESDAKKWLPRGPFSVVSKKGTPPSGDKHDYMSQAPYYWPNPNTKDGLPYIRRDGERNPELRNFQDHKSLDDLSSSTETLALAYYFTGDETYATKAAQLLRAWFIEPETRMNPNQNYGQAVPGINRGRGNGLIETRGLTHAVDAIGLLAGSKAWTDADQRGVEDWYSKFLDWMRESKNGRDEAAAKNNHGTYYDVQVVSFALFVGNKKFAEEVLNAAKTKRIALQVQPDGQQPLETERTKGWGYSVANLSGLMSLAALGENVNVDLWNYQSKDGRSIRKALDYLIPFALEGKKWPYQQIGEWPSQNLHPVLRLAAIKYPDGPYAALVAAKLPPLDPTNRFNLLVPRAAHPSQLPE